jgi:hypothetical protein
VKVPNLTRYSQPYEMVGFYPSVEVPLQEAMRQYLLIDTAQPETVAGRMINLAGDYTVDAISVATHGQALYTQPPDIEGLSRLSRVATQIELNIGSLLVLAAEKFETDIDYSDLPHAIRSYMKTASKLRSATCLRAQTAMSNVADDKKAAA